MSYTSSKEIADKIGEIFPAVIKGFLKRQNNELCHGKITMPQLIILNYLYKEGESRMTDLAHFLSVTTAATTGLVDRLVRCSYAERIFDPEDRRIIKIKASRKGIVTVKKINSQRHHMIMDIFGRLTHQEREDYLRIITRIRDILLASQKPEK